MTAQRLFVTVGLLSALTAVGADRALAQPNEHSMYVSVLNEAGAPVPDLGPTDFVVREDNLAREVVRVTRATDPMQLAVLVDNSRAATDYIRDIRVALQEFVKTITSTPAENGRKHQIAIIALAERPTILSDYSTEVSPALKGIDRIFAQSGSGTYLLDGLIEISRGLKKREAQRPVIVAITTEGPEFSSADFEQVLTPIRDSGAALHAIVVGQPAASTSEEARYRAIVLDEGPRTTGGRRDNLLTSMALPGKMKEVAAELTHQYRVTYVRPQSLIPPEHVTVTAKNPALKARGTLIKEPREQRP